MECAMCGMPLERIPDPVWSHGPNRDPYCSEECLDLATTVAGIDRRDHD